MTGDKSSSDRSDNRKECVPANLIDAGGAPFEKEACTGSLVRQVMDAYADKTVKVRVDRQENDGAGSGFYVLDGTHVVTAAHVIGSAKQIEVLGKDGEWRQAKLERLNDIEDLAMLEIPSLRPDAKRAVDINQSSDLSPGKAILGIGTPGLKDLKEFIAPGQAIDQVSQGDVMPPPRPLPAGERKDVRAAVFEALNSADPGWRQDAIAYMKGTRIVTDAAGQSGQSGGLVVGEDKGFAGVLNASFPDKRGGYITAYVPDDAVRRMVSEPSKFVFDYQKSSRLEPSQLLGRAALDIGAPAAAVAIPKFGKFAPAAYGLYKGSEIVSDVKAMLNPNSTDERRNYYARKSLEDAGYAAGGVGVSAGLMLPGKFKAVSLAIGGAAYLASTVSEFMRGSAKDQDVLVNVRRKDGDPRKPFLWDLNK
jgi:Trypsin-like serine proteases, typically periplasmic, contain C-terminal PDZ domain